MKRREKTLSELTTNVINCEMKVMYATFCVGHHNT